MKEKFTGYVDGYHSVRSSARASLFWALLTLRDRKLRAEIVFRAKPDAGRFVRVEGGQEFTGSAVISIEGPTADVDAVSTRARRAIERMIAIG